MRKIVNLVANVIRHTPSLDCARDKLSGRANKSFSISQKRLLLRNYPPTQTNIMIIKDRKLTGR